MKFIFNIILISFTSLSCFADFIIPESNIHLIQKAWSFNTAGPGAPKETPSYYNITINGTYYPGLRPWELRWDMIKDALDYSDKRVLELGCCMGLVSTCIKKYCDALSATGVDGTDQFLISQGSPMRVQAAKWVAQAFEVNVDFIQTNLNADRYESIIGYDYDIVFCFSLLNWIHDKDRFMHYLAHFDHVVFEGHDSLQNEIDRFYKYGFANHEILGHADRGRTVIHFYK